MRDSFYKLPLEVALLDTTNLAIGAAYYYPSTDGYTGDNFKDFSLTGKLICGADNTVTVSVEGTNDTDTVAANRDYYAIYGYDSYRNAVSNSMPCPASTTYPLLWDFDNINYKYFRVKVVVTNAGPGALSNTIILMARRKSL